jgi:5,10-methylene-tetrahydrofolate dehydrogenase/methenyl tetrahydrofolate cyclohydrolase
MNVCVIFSSPTSTGVKMMTQISGNLAGKVALVTGGSRSIGAAIAKRLAADGAAVALTYSSSPDRAAQVAAEIDAAGGRALAIEADADCSPLALFSVPSTLCPLIAPPCA